MTHNSFDLLTDITKPMEEFLQKRLKDEFKHKEVLKIDQKAFKKLGK